ncbi:MAG: phage holin family protein [Gemmatimonadaceae bacterium]
MTGEPFDSRTGRLDEGARVNAAAGAEPSLGELFRRLTTDTGELVRQEVSLAKVEIRETGATLARDGTKVGIALGLALAGVLALVAFLIVALGDLFDNYWLAALLVGVVFLAVGAILTRSAVNDIKRRGLAPDQTVGTLREDAAWAKEEAREVKRELTR